MRGKLMLAAMLAISSVSVLAGDYVDLTGTSAGPIGRTVSSTSSVIAFPPLSSNVILSNGREIVTIHPDGSVVWSTDAERIINDGDFYGQEYIRTIARALWASSHGEKCGDK